MHKKPQSLKAIETFSKQLDDLLHNSPLETGFGQFYGYSLYYVRSQDFIINLDVEPQSVIRQILDDCIECYTRELTFVHCSQHKKLARLERDITALAGILEDDEVILALDQGNLKPSSSRGVQC